MLCDIANPKGDGTVDIWQETHPIRFGEIDKSDRLTLSAVLQSFQEAAICHAENLGVGREDMARTGRVWILSRMSVLMERRPKYCETVTIRSWPRGGEKLFAMRNYDIRDKNNIPVVCARSAWLIVDIEKRRPLRPQSIMDTLPQNEGLDVFPLDAGGAAAIAERGNLSLAADTHAAERKALYTYVDYNGHVNNVSYIKWIEDVLDPKLLEKADKMRLDINYLNEITSGEVTEIYSAQIDYETAASTCAFAFEGRKKESGQTAFRAELRLWS
jgi:acyl-ACP thioesterase